MLLRFIALHGLPSSEADWSAFLDWKRAQLQAPECEMCLPEAGAPHSCEGCARTRADCPKRPRA